MTVTKDQAQMLATLAAACRPMGARRWDTAGTMAALEKVANRSLAEVVMATIRAAADRDVDSPGVIPTAGPHWQETRAVAPTPPPERLGRHERCSVCSHSEPACRMRNAGDHEFLSVERARAQAATFDPSALLADVKTAVAAAKLPPEPERPSLAEVVENSPQVAAMKAEMAAVQAALAKDRAALGSEAVEAASDNRRSEQDE